MRRTMKQWRLWTVLAFVASVLLLAGGIQPLAIAGPATTSGPSGRSQEVQGADGSGQEVAADRAMARAQRDVVAATAPDLPTTEAMEAQLYLPLIRTAQARTFVVEKIEPTQDVTLDPGVYTLDELSIPADVTVTLLGQTSFKVSGDVTIAGRLQANCTAVMIVSAGDLDLGGTLDNRCADGSGRGGDVTISTEGGTLTFGNDDANQAPAITTDGDINITNAASTPRWEFDVLPHQRSTESLPPVCAANADIIYGTALPETPFVVQFDALAADPDGGPLNYRWDFDGTSASGQNPTHSFVDTGTFPVTLTVSDDEGQTCTATLQLGVDDGEEALPAEPAAQIQLDTVIVEAGTAFDLAALAFDAQSDELSYAWDFGDGATASEPNVSHSYAAPGRYEVMLSVTDGDGNTTQVLAALYAHAATSEPTTLRNAQAEQQQQLPVCLGPAAINGQAPLVGRDVNLWWIGLMVLGPRFNARAANGLDGRDGQLAATSIGGAGQRGGNVFVTVNGGLIICGGASFTSGEGGKGGNATARAAAPRPAYARGGSGGNAGRIWVQASQGIRILPNISVIFGKGGDGGNARAFGGDANGACPIGTRGSSATAIGGNGGGTMTPNIVAIGNVAGVGNVQLAGGNAGMGGDGFALGGDGASVSCENRATGGGGGAATARGGVGGLAPWRIQVNFPAPPAATFRGGKGGNADAWAGWGGDANADGKPDATATGGATGAATATAGNGGAGVINGDGGTAAANAGWGGNATAIGAAGAACERGGNATATAGAGGNTEARFGRAGRGGRGGANGTATADAGGGGDATAMGGKGGDCNTCPAGAGGAGGNATATGGKGGDARGNGVRNGGRGGNATSNAGSGGNGANCGCFQAGGTGGAGGSATATPGNGGAPNGARGIANAQGGNGGNGGNGDGPGGGGAAGNPRGDPGAAGAQIDEALCKTPTPTTEPSRTAEPSVTAEPSETVTTTSETGTATRETVTATSETVTATSETVTATSETTTVVATPVLTKTVEVTR